MNLGGLSVRAAYDQRVRWLVVVAGACAGAPPSRPAEPNVRSVEPGTRSVVRARIAVDDDRFLDLTVDGWSALKRCDSVVQQQLERFGLGHERVTRPCDAAALPRPSSSYQLVTTEDKAFLRPPFAMYSIDTVVSFESRDACEAHKALLEAEEAKAFEERGIKRRMAMDKRIAVTKRSCDEARAQGIPDDLSCMCEVVQVPAPRFKPTPRNCRASQ